MEALTSEQTKHVAPFEINKLITDVPFQVYVDSDGMNSHGLMDVLRSPAHFYEHKVNRVKEKETPALVFGRLFHFAILEPQLFLERKVIEPKVDKRTKIGKETYAEFISNLKPGQIVVPEIYVDQLVGMSQKVLSHPLTKNLLAKGVREASFWWIDEETGELCKGRTDFITENGLIVDLKTTMDAREDYFSRDILKRNYHIQAAHYTNGARLSKVARHDAFVFLAIEKDPPYEIAVYPAGTSVLGVGDQWRSKAMRTYADCKKKNHWPGYNPEAKVIELPKWAEAVDPDEDREIVEEVAFQ